jgi:hypothetical protein
MDIFAAFATDEKKEVEGAWFEVPGGDARIKVARSSNPRFAKAVVSAYEKYAKAPKNDKTTSQQDAEYNRLLAQYVLVDWENISFQKEPLPYSVSSAERLLTIREFRLFVQKCSDDFDSFRVEQEEEVGNA